MSYFATTLPGAGNLPVRVVYQMTGKPDQPIAIGEVWISGGNSCYNIEPILGREGLDSIVSDIVQSLEKVET
jgi:hypothetical protein